MNNKKEFALLCDFAKLLQKYGPETFEGLANEMSNPEFAERFLEVLKTTAKVYRRLPKAGRKSRFHSPGIDFRSTLTSVQKSDAERGALLIQLYDGLTTKSLLPTLREMKNFALDNGLPPLKSTSHEKAIIPFVKTFLQMPVEDIRDYLRRIQPSPSSDDRSLEGWSNIIFGSQARVSKM